MHHVFISYSRTDGPWVHELVARLEASGLEAWIDQRDIPVTLPWAQEVRDAIDAADLVVFCASPAFEASEHCATERGLAEQAMKSACEVEVGTDLDRAAGRVRRSAAELDPTLVLRTELAVLARDWDRAARPGGGLVSLRHQRRLRRGAAADPPTSQIERIFLRSSRARGVRRAAITAAAALLIAGAALTSLLLSAAQSGRDQANDVQASGFTEARKSIQRIARDRYSGLSGVSALGQDESAVDALLLTAALEDPVPDDGFGVPKSATTFAEGAVGPQVVVTDGRRAWGRAAAESKLRTSERVAVPAGAPAATGRLLARTTPDSGLVEVLRDGRPWRRIRFGRRVRATTISPDGRRIAATVGDGVDVADLGSGQIRTQLRGSENAVRDVAWSAKSDRVWALQAELVVSWSVRDGEIVIDRPGTRFEAVMYSSDPANVWVATASGSLIEVRIGEGRVLRKIEIDDEIRSAAGSPDGTMAAISGRRGIWVVPLTRGSPTLVPTPKDCFPGRPAFADAGRFFLPCLGGSLLQVTTAPAAVERRLDLFPSGVRAARVLPGAQTVLVSEEGGRLYALDPRGPRLIFASRCGGSINRIAAAPDGRLLVPAGIGAGIVACLGQLRSDGGDPTDDETWRFTNVLGSLPGSVFADVSAVSRDGRAFAYGYTNGTIVMHPADNILPAVTRTNVVGRIRDMLVVGDDLVVVTAAGLVERLDFCSTCLSNKALAREADRRARRGVEIGTARRREGP